MLKYIFSIGSNIIIALPTIVTEIDVPLSLSWRRKRTVKGNLLLSPLRVIKSDNHCYHNSLINDSYKKKEGIENKNEAI